MGPMWALGVRYLRRHALHSLLCILGIALGVAAVFAIDLTNESVRRGFSIANSALSGGAPYRLVGASGDIDEDLYVALRAKHGVRDIAPVVSGYVGVRDRRFLLLGIDPLAYGGANPAPAGAGTAGSSLLDSADAAVLLASTADQLGVADTLDVRTDDATHTLNIVGRIDGASKVQEEGLRDVIITDIATAQVVLGKLGKLSYIEVGGSNTTRLPAVLPPSLQLVSNDNRVQSLEQITRAFHLNLTALSLLALVIGAFLIFNSMTLSVIQRRELFATLRTMGVTRSEVFGAVLLEALILGGIGLLLGLVFGYGLSNTLLHLVSRSINDLYFQLEVREVALQASSFFKATALGLGGTVAAAWMPAAESLRVSPSVGQLRSRLEESRRRLTAPAFLFGVALWVLSGIVLVTSGRSLIGGFGALFLIIFGFALVVPMALVRCIQWLQPVVSKLLGLPGRIAARSVRAGLSRTQVAVAALTIAVSAIIGVSVMISSFRASVVDWLDNALRADIYISQVGNYNPKGIDPALIEEIQGLPEVRAVSRGRWRRFETGAGVIQLRVLELDRYAFNNYQFIGASADALWDAFRRDGNVTVSEPYAYRHRLEVGDAVTLPTEQGEREFKVIGIFTDYGSDQGIVVMHRQNYDRWWRDPAVSAFALYLNDSVDADLFFRRLNDELLRETTLSAISNRNLRQRSLEIFDRTFIITEVLRLIAVIIAVIGVFSALLAIHTERAREFLILRALGMTPGELVTVSATESGLMGLIAGVLACPLGLVTAYVLIFVINQRSFGWSMDMEFGAGALLTAVALSIAAALAAGFYPARVLAKAGSARRG